MSRKHIAMALQRVWPAVAAGLLVSACAAPARMPVKPLDQVLRSVPDPQMQERWRTADAQGRLPPIAAIPAATRPVAQRRPVQVKEPAAEPRPPVIPAQTIATVQPWARTPVIAYDGAFQVTALRSGVIVGALKARAEPLELHYRLPGEAQRLDVKEQDSLTLTLRDDVVDAALQRRIVLRGAQASALLVFLAEGSQEPYRETIEPLRLTVEQLPEQETKQKSESYPPVRISYGAQSLTLKPGERGMLGEGEGAVQVYLIESLAVGAQQALLREGQPYYVSVILYRARQEPAKGEE